LGQKKKKERRGSGLGWVEKPGGGKSARGHIGKKGGEKGRDWRFSRQEGKRKGRGSAKDEKWG